MVLNLYEKCAIKRVHCKYYHIHIFSLPHWQERKCVYTSEYRSDHITIFLHQVGLNHVHGALNHAMVFGDVCRKLYCDRHEQNPIGSPGSSGSCKCFRYVEHRSQLNKLRYAKIHFLRYCVQNSTNRALLNVSQEGYTNHECWKESPMNPNLRQPLRKPRARRQERVAET